MTVMIDSFFGIHPRIIRDGYWKQMKPGEKDLYVFLMEESERRCTRQLQKVRDADVEAAVGAATRTLRDARVKLTERGLISCARAAHGIYDYVIHDPVTLKPYPGDARTPITVPKRWTPRPQPVNATPMPLPANPASDKLEHHGVHLDF